MTRQQLLGWTLVICLCVGVTSCTAHQVYREWQTVVSVNK